MGPALFVMVDVEEKLLRRQSRRLLECALELNQLVFAMRRRRVEHKDDTMGTFLDGTPALLIAPVTGHIPELDVNLPENAG